MSTMDEEMRSFTKVPGLLDRAFEVFYNDLLCKASQNTVEAVRKWIDQELPMGSMRKKIREQCFEKLMESYSEDKCSLAEETADIVAVLDCILDERLLEEQNELYLEIPFLSMKSISKLFSVIGHRCPGLGYLAINFRPGYDPIDSSDDLVAQEPFQQGQMLSSLRSLILSFEGNPYESRWDCNTSILGVIGKCCPTLSYLSYNGIGLRKKDVMELIFVGDLAAILFPSYEFDEMTEEDSNMFMRFMFGESPNGTPSAFDGDWSCDSVLPGLRVPPEFLNPLCSTLKELNYFDDWRLPDPFTDTLFAFALRHLPNFVSPTPSLAKMVPLIKLVYKSEKMLEAQELDFGEACREAAQSIGFQVNALIPPINLNYDDFLSMKKLDNVPLKDADTLRAIGCFCPQLEEVQLFARNSDIDVDELQSIFNKWPKVKVLKLFNVHPRCLPPVLNVFGSALKSLLLKNCPTPIDLSLLASCVALEDLRIFNCNVICEGNDPNSSRWTSETFLPSLNSLVTYECCLGVWASLLETKSTMMHLHLDCVHIGTSGHKPRLEWNQIPNLWPNLEYLRIDQCTALTMTEVSSLIPKMENLAEIWLPDSIFSEDPALTESIIEHFENVKIAVPNRADVSRTCPYQQLI